MIEHPNITESLTLSLESKPRDILFLPRLQKVFITGGNLLFNQGFISRWNLKSPKFEKTVDLSFVVWRMTHDFDQKMIFIGQYSFPCSISALCPESLTILKVFKGHLEPVSNLVFVNTHGFVSGSYDKTVKRWNFNDSDSEFIHRASSQIDEEVTDLVFWPEKSEVIIATAQCSIKAMKSDFLDHCWSISGAESFSSLVLRPDDSSLFAGTATGLLVHISLEKKEVLHSLQVHSGFIFSLCPYGEYVLTGSSDGSLAMTQSGSKSSVRFFFDQSSINQMKIIKNSLVFVTNGGNLKVASIQGVHVELPSEKSRDVSMMNQTSMSLAKKN